MICLSDIYALTQTARMRRRPELGLDSRSNQISNIQNRPHQHLELSPGRLTISTRALSGWEEEEQEEEEVEDLSTDLLNIPADSRTSRSQLPADTSRVLGEY